MDKLNSSFKEEIKKLKEMSFKDKLWYINEYYKIHIIGIIIIIFMSVSISRAVLKDDPILTTYFINNNISTENNESLKSDFLTYIDADKKSEFMLDTSMIIDLSDDKEIIGYEYFMKLSAMLSSSYIDTLIIDSRLLEHFISVGFSSNIKDMIDSDIYNELKDYIVYKNSIPTAINISTAPILKKYITNSNEMFLLIPQNTNNLHNINLFLKFIFDL